MEAARQGLGAAALDYSEAMARRARANAEAAAVELAVVQGAPFRAVPSHILCYSFLQTGAKPFVRERMLTASSAAASFSTQEICETARRRSALGASTPPLSCLAPSRTCSPPKTRFVASQASGEFSTPKAF